MAGKLVHGFIDRGNCQFRGSGREGRLVTDAIGIVALITAISLLVAPKLAAYARGRRIWAIAAFQGNSTSDNGSIGWYVGLVCCGDFSWCRRLG